jgi:hypothetical protein
MQLPIKENVVFKFTDVKLNKETSTSLLNQDTGEASEASKILSHVKDCNALSDQSNPIIQQIVFFAKMFENFANNDLKQSKEEIEAEFHTKINPSNSYQDFILNSLNEKREFLNIETLKDLIYRTFSKGKENVKVTKNEEKKKMKKIMSLIIYLQMRKIEMKLNYFNEFERSIQSENQQLKSMESQIIQDRIKLALKKSEINQLARKFKEIINPVNNANSQNIGLNSGNKNKNNTINNSNNDFEKILDLNEETKKEENFVTNNANRSSYTEKTEFLKKIDSDNPNNASKLVERNGDNKNFNANAIQEDNKNINNNETNNHEGNQKDDIKNNSTDQNEKNDIEMKNEEPENNSRQSDKKPEKTFDKNEIEEGEKGEEDEEDEEEEFEEVKDADEEEAENELEEEEDENELEEEDHENELEEEDEEASENARNQNDEKNQKNPNYDNYEKEDNDAVAESENAENNNNIETLNCDKGEEGATENHENSNNNDNEENDNE